MKILFKLMFAATLVVPYTTGEATAATLYASENIGTIVTYDTSSGNSTDIALSRTVLVSGLNNPNGITTDRYGNIYVANTNSTEIIVYRPDGGEIRRFGNTDNLEAPTDVAIDKDGNPYVVNGAGTTNAISKFDASGNFVKYLPVPKWTAGLYIDIDNDGFLYVSGTLDGDSVVAKFSGETFLEAEPVLASRGVAVDPTNGNINIAQGFPTGASLIQIVDAQLDSVDTRSPGVDFLNFTLGIDVAADGSVFAANFGEKAGTGSRTISWIGADGVPIVDWLVSNPQTWARDLALAPAPVPIPASVLLMMTALSALFLGRRRCRA